MSASAVLRPKGYGLSFSIGLLLHLGAFRYVERDLSAQRIINSSSLSYLATVGTPVALRTMEPMKSYQLETVQPADAFRTVGILFSWLVAGIYSSMDRVSRSFPSAPGPFLARFTNFYVSCKISHTRMSGSFTRKLSVNKRGAIDAVFLDTDCMKGSWYNLLHPMVSVQMVRDREAHAKRRKAWKYGFTSKSLRDYGPRVPRYSNQLLASIEACSGTDFNASLWFNFYSFNVMGEFSLGHGFRMLEDGVAHFYMDSLHETKAVGRSTYAMRALPLYRKTAIWNAGVRKFNTWISGQVQQRIQNKPKSPYILTWVLEDYEYKKDHSPQDMLNLYGALARHSREDKKRQEEVDECFQHHDKSEHVELSKLRYLQACIDESLRLHPPVPSGVQRMTPEVGLQVDNVWLPGDTIVLVPCYTQFMPFSTGHVVCIGNQLGLMEARFVTNAIVHGYTLRYAGGQRTRTQVL
ncbi:cytochrome P450 [Colletotrichum eremochloae]|nr:cytochrome P450 [Colletotrichum eremochloae]